MTSIRASLFIASALAFISTGCADDVRPEDSGTLLSDSGTGLAPDAGLDGSPDTGVVAAQDAGATDTWSSFAAGFFATYCVECHDGGTRDYRTIEEVRRDAASIRCGVSDVTADGCGPSPAAMLFPVGSGPRPSVEERQRLVSWIEDGLP